jgi:hypothetical protein
MEIGGIIVLLVAWLLPCSVATWFAIKGSKGDCSPKEKRMTKRTAIGVIIGVTIMVALVACGVTFDWIKN